MDLRQVEYVLAVVDHGTFTAAAESIPVSQPALSQGIRTLEQELGLELFHRIGRGVILSAAGTEFIRPARQLLQDRRRVIEAVAAVVGLEGGTLELVALPTLAVTPLVELIGRFRGAHPAVSIRVHEHDGDSEHASDLVRDGVCEIGLVEFPHGQPPQGLVGRGLGSQAFLAVCPPGTPRPHRGSLSAADLARLPLVATPVGTSSRRLLDEVFAAWTGPPPTIAVESNHRELLLPLVLSGAATAVLPAPMAENARTQGAVVLPLDPPLQRTIGLAHRAGVLSPAADTFVHLADEQPVAAVSPT